MLFGLFEIVIGLVLKITWFLCGLTGKIISKTISMIIKYATALLKVEKITHDKKPQSNHIEYRPQTQDKPKKEAKKNSIEDNMEIGVRRTSRA